MAEKEPIPPEEIDASKEIEESASTPTPTIPGRMCEGDPKWRRRSLSKRQYIRMTMRRKR